MVFRETMVELVSGEGEVIPTNIVGVRETLAESSAGGCR